MTTTKESTNGERRWSAQDPIADALLDRLDELCAKRDKLTGDLGNLLGRIRELQTQYGTIGEERDHVELLASRARLAFSALRGGFESIELPDLDEPGLEKANDGPA